MHSFGAKEWADKCEQLEATIADLQGKLEVAQNKQTALEKSVRNLTEFYDKYNGTPCEQIRHQQEVEQLQQRVAQLEGEKGTLRLGLNALRDSYDELDGRHSTLQADHARVLGLVRDYARAKVVFDANRLREDHYAWKERFRVLVDAEQALIDYHQAAGLPAQPACANHFSDGSKIFPSRECACKPAQPAQGGA